MKKIFINTPLDNHILVPQEAAHHLFTVLRHKEDIPFVVSNFNGETATYVVTSVDDGKYYAKLLERIESIENETQVILVQSFLKGDKFEFLLQKATELQIHTIYGVATAHCVAKYDRKKLESKESRWGKILIEASQQCGRSTVPKLVVHETFQHIAETYSNQDECLWLIAYEREDKKTIKAILRDALAHNHYKTILICIGPEGGYHPDEVAQLENMGAHRVSLGSTTLRAETAALAAISMIQYELLD